MSISMRALLVAGLVSTAVAPAASQSIPESDMNFINHLSVTAVANLRCPTYELNELLVAMVMTMNDFPGDQLTADGPYKSHFLSQVADAKSLHERVGTEVFCMTAWVLYGDDGVNVPKLLRQR
jgi:hypothetical protein